MKTEPRQKVDQEIAALQRETERLKEALLEPSIELQLIRKKQLGLEGDLRNRHLAKDFRLELMGIVKWAIKEDKDLGIVGACEALEIYPRAHYRWIKGNLSNQYGGGGKNKITPLEEKRIVSIAKKNSEWRCRNIAYQLEKKSLAFVRKTTVAEVMKKHGLNHSFEQTIKPPMILPEDMLIHEPWKKILSREGTGHG